MSHYPSTQELAAFRVAIADDHWTAPHVLDWRGHAFPSELRDGIGYHEANSGAAIGGTDSAMASMLRREASSLRSRAYAAPRGKSGCYDLWLAAQTFAPGSSPHPILASDTWSEDEPRSPLPIRYRPSLVITR